MLIRMLITHSFISMNLFQIQIFGYNSQLYTNFTDALYKAQGIVGVAVLLQVILYILWQISCAKFESISIHLKFIFV